MVKNATKIECLLFMEVDNIMVFHVSKGHVSRCKDSRMGTIFVNTYFLLNETKFKLKKMHFNTVEKNISNWHVSLHI